MSDTPRIGAAIVLMDGRLYTYASRVEGSTGGRLTVARPSGLPASSPYDDGAEFEMSWTGETGVTVVPVRLVQTRRERHLPLWDLELLGESWVEQRREFVRVPVFGRITIEPAEPDGIGSKPLSGVLIDLSEAAVQCTIWADPDDPRLEVGALMLCRFRLHDEEIDSVGTILKQRPGDEVHQTNVVIDFVPSEPRADKIRRHVYAIQIDMRQAVKAQEAAEAAQRAARAALDESDRPATRGDMGQRADQTPIVNSADAAPAARIRAAKWSAAKTPTAAEKAAVIRLPSKQPASDEQPASGPAGATNAQGTASAAAPNKAQDAQDRAPEESEPQDQEPTEIQRRFMVGKIAKRPAGTEEFDRDL